LDEFGKVDRMAVFSRDISDQKKVGDALAESEYKYRMLFENMTEGFALHQIITNDQGEVIDFRFLEANSANEKLTGYKSEDIIGKTIIELMPHADKDQIKKYGNVALTGEPMQFEYYSKTFNRHMHVTAFCPQSGQFATIFEDISERKIVELALIESEKRFKDLFQRHHSIMMLIDPESGRIIDANQSAVDFYGYSHSKLQSMNIADINTLPKDHVKENYKKAHREESNTFVFPHRLADGSERIVEVHSTPINVPNKKVLFSIIHDITERKLVQQSLAESEEKYRNVFSTEKDSLFLIDENTYAILEINDSACDLYGYTRDEMLNLKNYDLSAQPIETKRLTKEYQGRIDFRYHKKKDGTIFPVDISASRFSLSGKPILLAAIRDISVLKKIEHALRISNDRYDKLTSTIPVGVYVLNSKLDGTLAFEYVSSKLAEIIGVDIESLKADAFLLIKCIHPEDKESFVKLINEGLRVTMQPLDWKGRFIVDGKIKWLQIISTPEKLENGDILRQGLIIDITENVLADAEIQSKNEALSKSLAEKDKFFSIIAHDLRSPFNGLLGFTQILDEDLQNMNMDQIQNIASILRKSTKNVFNLVVNLLEWSRLQRGLTKLQPVKFFLALKINEILEPVLEKKKKKGTVLTIHIPENLLVFADINMIGSMIRNLVSNAVKFTPKGGHVIISAYYDTHNNVEISVQDNGIGMSNDLIGKLFLLDENTSRKGTDKETGTGLGLILCKEFIEKHHGKIWVESEVGKGSTFHFALPIALD
jgi:PAS domain S-box-containing protein